ncbi:hypothetical protein CMK11_22365 [Candidatus Poribacteria bacterium]|nr:hypothetical protein [Candidatus Poribacteria bacterium]
MLQVGAAETIITPPIGTELAGWSFGPSVGILDHLTAQALYVETDGQAAAIVTADVLGFGADFVGRVRHRLATSLGLCGESVLLAASHTHSGPAVAPLRQWGPPDADYVRLLESHLVGLVEAACRDARPATASATLGFVDGLNENRRSSDGRTDDDAPALRFDANTYGGSPIAVIYGFACHPVTLHTYGGLISPDFPGYAREAVRDALGADTTVMFALGACGDVNPKGYQAGRTTEARARDIGVALGDEVARACLGARPTEPWDVRVSSTALDLPVVPLPDLAELQSQHDEAAAEASRLSEEGAPWPAQSVAQIKRDWAQDAIAADRTVTTMPCEIQAMRIGSAALVAMPLEVFAETGIAIRESSPFDVTLLCTNANGAVGYLPTRDVYATEHDYTHPSGLAPKIYGLHTLGEEAEPMVRSAAIEALHAVHGDC